MRADALLAALAGAGPIRERVAIVVAHPDDETIGLGAQLHRLRDALLVHVTDGAPRDGEDARHHGFPSATAYAATRRAELAAALAVGGAGHLRAEVFDIPDKEAAFHLPALSLRLAALVRRERPAAVITHAYEGGHPDHDAAAFVVSVACRLAGPSSPARERMARMSCETEGARGRAAGRPHPSLGEGLARNGEEGNRPPAIIEVPLYHAASGRMVTGVFPPGGCEGTAVALDAAAQQRKRAMIECFQTQRGMLAQFPLEAERFRVAPEYDFRRPPAPPPLLYEAWGWEITGPEWRRQAAAALLTLGMG